jgi:hypothetical protein
MADAYRVVKRKAGSEEYEPIDLKHYLKKSDAEFQVDHLQDITDFFEWGFEYAVQEADLGDWSMSG